MKFLICNERDNVATLSLNRPEVRNAFNPEMINEIKSVFTDLSSKENLRAIVLRGEGKAFCAGGDLAWMKEMAKYTSAENLADANNLFSMFETILNCPIPVISVVHGAAFGGALGLIACSDQVIATDKTQFCFSEVKLGIAPAVISAFILRKLSVSKVQPYMLSGVVFNSEQAKDIGLVHDIVEEDQINDKLETILLSYVQSGPKAVRATKKLIADLQYADWLATKNLSTRLIAELRAGSEGQEGLKSFFEKRDASWKQNSVKGAF